jgi:hypothetical protein
VENVPEIPKKNIRRLLILAVVSLAVVLLTGIFILAKYRPSPKVSSLSPITAALADTNHRPLPAELRGVYVTAATAGSDKRLVALLASTGKLGYNAVVVDLKNDSGSLSFVPKSAELLAEAPVSKTIADLDKVVEAVHNAGFYIIARVPVFQDPAYAKKHPATALKRSNGSLWQDRRGLSWVDPAAEASWKYNVAIAKEAYGRGFDEIQFDYIRFATDGDTKNIVYPYYDAKKEKFRNVIARLFVYLDAELRGNGIPISVDLFGFTAWHQNDLGIGQWYDDGVRHFDFVSPMVYPSHYPSGTLGYAAPAKHPYEIVSDSLKKGNEVLITAKAGDANAVLATQRPWLQAFDMGATYTAEMMLAQIKASRENGVSGFIFWNAANNYARLPDLSK